MARRTRPYDKKDASNLQNPREDFIKSTAGFGQILGYANTLAGEC